MAQHVVRREAIVIYKHWFYVPTAVRHRFEDLVARPRHDFRPVRRDGVDESVYNRTNNEERINRITKNGSDVRTIDRTLERSVGRSIDRTKEGTIEETINRPNNEETNNEETINRRIRKKSKSMLIIGSL